MPPVTNFGATSGNPNQSTSHDSHGYVHHASPNPHVRWVGSQQHSNIHGGQGGRGRPAFHHSQQSPYGGPPHHGDMEGAIHS